MGLRGHPDAGRIITARKNLRSRGLGALPAVVPALLVVVAPMDKHDKHDKHHKKDKHHKHDKHDKHDKHHKRDKERMKELETDEEKRARRLAKKAAKDEKRAEEGSLGGYSNQSNPWNDPNLTQAFVWGKKVDKDQTRGVVEDQSREAQKRKRDWPENDGYMYFTICLLMVCLIYSLTVNFLSLNESTMCLRIAGGEGCEGEQGGAAQLAGAIR